MLGAETFPYVLMAGVALVVLLSLLALGLRFRALCVVLSQIPFWVGYGVWHIDSDLPVRVNIFTDMAACAVFVWLAYKMDEDWLIWMGVVFLCALITDICALSFGMNYYLELQEAFHYCGLILIVGKAGVVGIDRHIRGYISGLQN